MEVNKVRASVGVTVNLGNFESLRLEYSAEAELNSPTDAVYPALDVLREDLIAKLQEDLRATGGGRDMVLKVKK